MAGTTAQGMPVARPAGRVRQRWGLVVLALLLGLAGAVPGRAQQALSAGSIGQQAYCATCDETPPSAPQPPAKLGVIEGVTLTNGAASLRGWTCQRTRTESNDVHVYIGGPAGIGKFVVATPANQWSEPAVAAACGLTGSWYRFSIPLFDNVRVPYPGWAIYVYAVSPVGSPTLLQNSGSVTVPAIVNDAAFVSQTVPTTVTAGSSTAVRVQMRNTGNTVWSAGTAYRLGAQNPIDNNTWGTARVNPTTDITPGQIATFDFTMKAPATGGVRNFQWRMVRDGVAWFGASTPNVAVNVATGTLGATPNPCTIPWGAATCSTTVSWSSNVAAAELWVTTLSGTDPKMMSRAQNGSAPATWIQASGARFHLKAGGWSSLTLATADVRGNPTVNATPGVTLTAPTTGQSIVEGNLTLTAWAGDSDDGVARVEFYADGARLGEDTTSPYSLVWRPGIGAHVVAARAIDTRGAIATSASASIVVASDATLLRRIGYDYDEEGRLIAERHVDPTSGLDVVAARYAYDDAGRLLSTTDALGRMTTGTYDALGRLASSRDAAGGVTAFAYDIGDRITQVTDPRGLATRYVFDGFGQLRTQVSPDTGTTRFEYSAAGLNTKMTRNDGSVTTYAYDGAGRLLQAKAGTQERNFKYDTCTNGIGRLCVAELRENGTARSTVSQAYTPQGGLTLRRDSGIDEAGQSYDGLTAYARDGLGRVTGISYPSGIDVGYAYNTGRLSTMTVTVEGATSTVASNITYQPFGPIDGWIYGNGLQRHYSFDRNGRLYALSAGTGSTVVQSLTYGFNAADEITAITNGVDAGLSRKYAYDTNGRVAKETLRGVAWNYDANGNLHLWTGPGAQTTSMVDPSSNRVTSYTNASGTRNYAHDALGNRTSETAPGTSKTYGYDGFKRLRTATVNGATSTYTVNALDQRIGKKTPMGSTRFTYAGQNQLLAEQGAGGWTSYLWLGGELVAVVKPDKQLRYVHNDHLGRPEAVTDSAKQAVWRANNQEYGRTVALDAIGGLNLGFPGQYYDAETGLSQNGYREYDAALGRYTQSDPVGLAAGINTYAYVGGNPLSRVDPLGLTECDVDAAYQTAKDAFPGLNFGAGRPKMDLPDVSSGGTTLGEAHFVEDGRDGYIHLSSHYKPELGAVASLSLLRTVIHEALHFTRPLNDQRPWNNYDHAFVAPEAAKLAGQLNQTYQAARQAQCGCEK